MKKNGRLILFDLDGVVLDSVCSIFLTVRYLLEERDVPFENLPDLTTFLQTVSLPSAAFYRRYGITWSPAELDECFLRIMPLYEELDGEYLGMAKTVAELRRCGFKTAIVSGGLRAYVERQLSRFHLRDLFDAVFTDAAPKTEAMLDCCRQFKVSPAETYFVGDFQSDMRDGRAAGVIPIGFTGGYDFMRPVLEHAGAQVCIDEPEELLEVISG